MSHLKFARWACVGVWFRAASDLAVHALTRVRTVALAAESARAHDYDSSSEEQILQFSHFDCPILAGPVYFSGFMILNFPYAVQYFLV